MDGVQVHLALNHFPSVGTLFAIILLIVGLIGKKQILVNTSLITFIVLSLIAIPVFSSGEEAEETIEHYEGISHDTIHEHEEAGEAAFYGMIALGVLSLITLLLQRTRLKPIVYICLLVSIFVFGMIVYAANIGGKIRHVELSAEAPLLDQDKPQQRIIS